VSPLRICKGSAKDKLTALEQIGGSAGHVSVEIAKKHPNMSFIVQDRPELAANFATVVPESLKSRITFQPHDFFTPEPVKGASIYFLKHILHDWSDEWGIRILKQILPVMAPDSRIIVMEGVFPDPGTAPVYVTKIMSSLDMQMLTAINSKERTAHEWAELCRRVDEKLVIKSINEIPGIAFGLIEIVLEQ
jgi:6-hydroxytryprostatin B O-methyltransferase